MGKDEGRWIGKVSEMRGVRVYMCFVSGYGFPSYKKCRKSLHMGMYILVPLKKKKTSSKNPYTSPSL